MAVYVDDARIRAQVGRLSATWCHMWADSEEELHAFALRLGLRRQWFQGPPRHFLWHYDVTETKRRRAMTLGAIEVHAGDLTTHPASRQYVPPAQRGQTGK